MWKAIKVKNGIWSIEYNERVQPFGAIFSNERGEDVGKLVKAAVARLNKGINNVHGHRDWYFVTMQPSGVADIVLDRQLKCKKCTGEMLIGYAYQNEMVTFGGGTSSRLGDAKLTRVWKCKECGHSVTC